MWARRRRFYCRNFAGCAHAQMPRVYDEAQFRKDPVCRGNGADGCGQPLFEGSPIDRRGLLVLGVIGLAALAWLVREAYFPAPLEGIAFESTSTRAVGRDAPAEVALVRQGDGLAALEILYRTEDGSAKAGVDYVAAQGRVVLGRDEKRKLLKLQLLPAEPAEATADKRFSLVLVNVQGTPSHAVLLAAPPLSIEALSQGETLVRALSGVALDVGTLYVKIGIARSLLGAGSSSADDRRHYADRLAVLIANSEQARHRYGTLLGELCAADRRGVAQAFTAWSDKLMKSGMQQQRAATLIAQQQQTRHCEDRKIDMETWARQLSDAIPRPASPSVQS